MTKTRGYPIPRGSMWAARRRPKTDMPPGPPGVQAGDMGECPRCGGDGYVACDGDGGIIEGPAPSIDAEELRVCELCDGEGALEICDVDGRSVEEILDHEENHPDGVPEDCAAGACDHYYHQKEKA